MKAQINRQLFNTTTFDSGSLGLLAMVIHQFREPGVHHVLVKKNREVVAQHSFIVDEESEKMQLNIDLSQPGHHHTGSHHKGKDCCCHKGHHRERISPKGYVLFHVSKGTGYSVSVADSSGRAKFESTKLGEGDLFAVSLLKPGVYQMVNKLGKSEGEIHVEPLTPKMGPKAKNLETLFVEVTPKGFEPRSLKAFSTQGIVFRIQTGSRIVITPKKEKSKEPIEPQKGPRLSRNLEFLKEARVQQKEQTGGVRGMKKKRPRRVATSELLKNPEIRKVVESKRARLVKKRKSR